MGFEFDADTIWEKPSKVTGSEDLNSAVGVVSRNAKIGKFLKNAPSVRILG